MHIHQDRDVFEPILFPPLTDSASQVLDAFVESLHENHALKKSNKARPRRTVLPVPFVKRGVSATVVLPALSLNFVPSRLLIFRAN